MSATAIAWVLIAITLFILSFRRPVWGIALYLQTFFAAPHLWWWGRDLPQARYALWTGLVLLITTAFYNATNQDDDRHKRTYIHTMTILMAGNAIFVHLLLAVDRAISIDTLTELLKYNLLFYLMWKGIRNKTDLSIVLITITLGGFYIGWEVTINERGDFSGSRLEGVGAPSADNANSLASVMLTVLPLAASLFVHGTWRHKLIAIVGAPLILNVLLLCNSRGAFLGLIATAIAFVLVARGETRKKAVRALAFGAVALFLLLGDPKILDRFATTFVGSEERDNSADSRIVFWKAGFKQLADYPLGAGGGSFKFSIGRRYQAEIVGDEATDRSLHQGYLTEATDWGYQGLALKLIFFFGSMLASYRTIERCRKAGKTEDALIGICILTSGIGLAIHCFFGAFLGDEWTYWVAALNVRYAELYLMPPVAEAVEPAPGVELTGPRAA